MKKIILLSLSFIASVFSFSQTVGIGTATPHAKAALEVKATDKGILFPRLNNTQRNAITNPPNGLHIYNTDEHCLNYYDSVYAIWNCYCSDCQVVVINIGMGYDMCNVDFYNQYAKNAPAKKYIINIPGDTYINGCAPGDTALSFANMPSGISVVINNHGFILGGGGKGGDGGLEPSGSGPCAVSFYPAQAGKNGGAAIVTTTGVLITVNNYGVVAGGGGGGGGSSKGTTSGYGGGGGGGAGFVYGPGGTGGGYIGQNCGPFGCGGCVPFVLAQPGGTSTDLSPGNGGAGYNGGPAGGNGGNRGQAGQNGNVTSGGGAGKAIGGGSGNSIINLGSGQSFGIVN